MKPTFLILAAGMGSRFGGLKQIEPVGPNDETLIDYSIYDAIRSGFGKIVFVIRRSFSEEFKALFSPKLKGKIEVDYVFQELDDLPQGFSLPGRRTKPWGTAHAILAARNVIKEPFCALNADDFYGYDACRVMADFLKTSVNPNEYSMVGYKLSNTLSNYGSVSRGICSVDGNSFLNKITETVKILRKNGRIVSIEADGSEKELTGDESVSMNIWGFKPSVFPQLENNFADFLKQHIHEPKSESFIPSVVADLINSKQATVKVLEADSLWFGVTYKEDKPRVVSKINELIKAGEYPEKLF